MVVQRRLARNRPVVPVAQLPKAEARHPPNPLANFPILDHSLINQCSVAINSDSDSFHNSLSLGSSQVSPDLQAVPHPAHSVKEEVMECNRDRNQARNPFHLVPVDMVGPDRSLELSLDLNPSQVMVMVVKLDQDRLLHLNQSVVVSNMVLTEH